MPFRFFFNTLCISLAVFFSGSITAEARISLSFYPPDTAQINTLNRLTEKLIERQQLDSAYKIIQEAITLSSEVNYVLGQSQSENFLARIYYIKGDYVKSLQHGLAGLKLAQSINAGAEIAYSKNVLGLVHLMQGERKLALEEFNAAAVINKKNKNHKRLAANYFNMGLSYSEMGNRAQAKIEFTRSKALSEARSIRNIAAMSTNRLADLFFHEGALDSAKFYFHAVLDNQQFQSDWENSFAYTGLAACYQKEGRHQQAITEANRGLELAEKIGAKWDAQQALHVLFQSFTSISDYKSANEHLLKQQAYKDSLMSEDKRRLLDSIHLTHARTINTTLLQENKIARQELQISWLIAGIAVIVLLFTVFFSVIIFQNSRRTRALNRRLKIQSETMFKGRDRLREQNQLIGDQNQLLYELNQTKNWLLSIIAHDVRAPLSSIIGILELLKSIDLAPQQTHDLHIELYNQTNNTLNMLNNLLHWSAGQQDGFSIRPTEIYLPTKIEEVLSVLLPIAHNKGLTIRHAPITTSPIIADNDHIKIILQNILGNAIKYTGPGGAITIDYLMDETSVAVRIQDNGIGMSAEIVEKLLKGQQPLHSVPGTGNEYGIGLGMMLVRMFADKNQAKLDVESQEDRGTTFIVTFKMKSIG
jgi:signal transduction histidine kinase/predicted RNA binding protein with dsRBD fold (UPF0201 family)